MITRERIGTVAGAIKSNAGREQYRVIRIDRVLYRANRLAWLYMTGAWPIHEVDHKDRNSLNDRFDNLREATRSQNGANTNKKKGCSSKYRGVTKHKNKWMAQISKSASKRDNKYLGLFENEEDAAKAYDNVARDVFGDFAQLNFPQAT